MGSSNANFCAVREPVLGMFVAGVANSRLRSRPTTFGRPRHISPLSSNRTFCAQVESHIGCDKRLTRLCLAAWLSIVGDRCKNMNNPFKRISVAAKRVVLSSLQRFLHDQISKRVRPYMASGLGSDGVERSDVAISPDGNIHITNCVMLPSALDELLLAMELPFHVAMAHCKEIHISIPWRNLSSGDWKVKISGLMVVLNTKERADWSIDDVRMPL